LPPLPLLPPLPRWPSPPVATDSTVVIAKAAAKAFAFAFAFAAAAAGHESLSHVAPPPSPHAPTCLSAASKLALSFRCALSETDQGLQ
jgi:hypothetical protein